MGMKIIHYRVACLMTATGIALGFGPVGTAITQGEKAAALKSPQSLEVGQAAPDFTLPDQDGKMHHLTDYKGKTVILAFYPKDFTGG